MPWGTKRTFDAIRCSYSRRRTCRIKRCAHPGRCHRGVLLCDVGRQRNLSSHAIHGLLGREGRSPASFLDEAREELCRYRSVTVRGTLVTAISTAAEGFEFVCADGTTGNASKVLLATGLVDDLPELAGIKPLYGVSAHHCLYCDGFEYAGKPVAAYGKGDKGAELAVMMKHWMSDVVACSDGTEVSAQAVRKLEEHNISQSRLNSLKVPTESSQRSSSRTGRICPGPVCSFRPAAIRHLTYPNVLAASVVRKGAS
jgi:thioredoxin reductase